MLFSEFGTLKTVKALGKIKGTASTTGLKRHCENEVYVGILERGRRMRRGNCARNAVLR